MRKATPRRRPSRRRTTASQSFGMLGRMVDRAIQRGDEAKQLKDSMQKLGSVLTPQQIQTARMLMRPDRGMGMHQGWRNWHRDHMWARPPRRPRLRPRRQ